MAQISKPRTPRKSSYRGFEGIDLKKTHSGDESIAFIENFRINDDGSLEKRCGFKNVYDYDGTAQKIRASHSMILNGTEVCYFLLGNSLKKYNSSTQTVSSIGEISETPDDEKTAFFFEYLDSLYICDGEKIRKVKDDTLSNADFYIPLYGKDWNELAGESKELPNLLWPKLAITYKLNSPAKSYLSLGTLKVEAIDALYRNGVLLNSEQYRIHEKYNSITVSEFADNDVFLAIVTFVPDEAYVKERSEILNSAQTSVFYELNKNNLFFWGNEQNNKVFYSTSIDKEAAEITSLHPHNNEFYVPVGSFFKVASERDRIKAFIRHYDRVLIMTDTSTWITNLQELENNSLKLKNINSSIGCAVKNGCVRIENTLFSIGKDAIYAWSADTDELNECNAYSISDPLGPLLNESFFKDCIMHLNYVNREIWFYSPSQNQVWIYSYKRKAWYSFSGFKPSAFLSSDAEVRFVEDKAVYIFDSALTSDIRKVGESEIVAKIKSGELEFNSKNKKKLSSTTVRGSSKGGTTELYVLLDGKKELRYSVPPNSSHSVIPFRTKSGSFSAMTFELTAKGKGTQIIHGIELDAD